MRLGFEIKMLDNLIEKRLRACSAIEALDKMTNMHGRIIGFLCANEDKEIFQRDIERNFLISGPSVSEVLKLMEKNGLIVRMPVEKDARLKKIVLTDKARKLHIEVRHTIDFVEEELSSMLTSEEYEAFTQTASKLIDKLKEKQQKEGV